MFEIGRLAVKIAGRDAGKKCVVVDTGDKGFLIIDGQTRRKAVNPKHLEPLDQTVKISKGASSDDVAKALKPLNIEVTKTKPKSPAEQPKKKKVNKKAQAEDKKPAKKEVKKEAKDKTPAKK
jgi:large subunit ribosomal protein L14e